eukprot:3792982-Prorocentrum_lima.AAC.1
MGSLAGSRHSEVCDDCAKSEEERAARLALEQSGQASSVVAVVNHLWAFTVCLQSRRHPDQCHGGL